MRKQNSPEMWIDFTWIAQALSAAIAVLFVIGSEPAVAAKKLSKLPEPVVADHQLVSRVVVFPFQGESDDQQESLENAWWQTRDLIFDSKRFLVASKQFLLKSEAFQPRAQLQPADVLLLGRLLDAHAILTGELKDRKLSFYFYDTTNGQTLWTKTLDLHPSLTVNEQLNQVSLRLTKDLLANFPYQGFVITDPLQGKPVYVEDSKYLVQVSVGAGAQIAVGDSAQWIRVTLRNLSPLFLGGGQTTVFAEGQVVEVQGQTIVVAVNRALDAGIDRIQNHSLVMFPKEYERLQQADVIKNGLQPNLSTDLLRPEADPLQSVVKERRPLAATFSFLGSVVAFLLLAF